MTDQRIDGTAGNDTLQGGNGNDTIEAGQGNDLIIGGSGNDSLYLVYGDTAQGGPGDDLIQSSNAYDVAAYTKAQSDYLLTWKLDTSANFYLEVKDKDTSESGEGTDRLYNVDELNFAGQATALPPLNYIHTDSVGTRLLGTAGNDTLQGGNGNDTIEAGQGNDLIIGGSGNDSLYLVYGDTAQGGPGDDLIQSSNAYDVAAYTKAQSDYLLTWKLDTSANFYLEVKDKDTSESGEGTDRLYNVDELNFADQATALPPLNYIHTDSVDTRLLGTAGNDTLQGGDGNDTIEAGQGNDLIIGGSGNDSLYLVYGDTAQGGPGDDLIQSSNAYDVAAYTKAQSDYLLTWKLDTSANFYLEVKDKDTSESGEGTDRLYNVDELNFADQATALPPLNYIHTDSVDTRLLGTAGNDTLQGGDGNDTIEAGQGNDLIIGGSGNDSLYLVYGDTAQGGPGDDLIQSSNAYDVAAYTKAQSDYLLTWKLDTSANFYLEVKDKDTSESGEGTDRLYNVDELNFADQATALPPLNYIHTDSVDTRLLGTAGNDTLQGGDGNDTIEAGQGNDLIIGGSGNDSLYLVYGDTAQGGPGDDLIQSSNAYDVAAYTKAQSDYLLTWKLDTSANFYLEVKDKDTSESGEGTDRLYNVDELNFAGQATALPPLNSGNSPNGSVIGGTLGSDTLIGGAGDDLIVGDKGADSIDGQSGNDTAYGDDGDDVVLGGDGDDQLHGDDDFGNDGFTKLGNDYLDGGAGNDVITGGRGNDTIIAGTGDDLVDGGVGSDSIDGQSGNDTAYGDDGDDVVLGGDGDDQLHGDDDFGNDGFTKLGNDYLDGGAGNDVITGGRGNDTIIAGTGDDLVDGGVGSDSIDGQSGNDTAYGDDGDDVVLGGDGDDQLHGDDDFGNDGFTKLGNDYLDGGAGNDVITGGRGNDTIAGGVGDNIDAGADDDVVLYVSGIASADGGTGTDRLVLNSNITSFDLSTSPVSGFEIVEAGSSTSLVTYGIKGTYPDAPGVQLIASAYGSTLEGGVGADTLVGKSGNDLFIADDRDSIVGGGGMDIARFGTTVSGAELSDADLTGVTNIQLIGSGPTFDFNSQTESLRIDATAIIVGVPQFVRGGFGADTIIGPQANIAPIAHTLIGGAGDDVITGGASADLINGGAGNDTLAGGEGNDTVVYTGNQTDYTISLLSQSDSTYQISSQGEGTDNISGFEFVQFADTTMSMQALGSITLANVTPICFTRGTHIQIGEQSKPVESLSISNQVSTTNASAAVKWIGYQRRTPEFAQFQDYLPVRIAAGALDDNLPFRDLYLSPDHAVLVDGHLIHAKALVNGKSIVQTTQWTGDIEYYHIETEAHEIIYAEGVPCETFIDNVSREQFDNYAEYQALYPNTRIMKELPLPRVKFKRQLPLAIKQRLESRISELDRQHKV